MQFIKCFAYVAATTINDTNNNPSQSAATKEIIGYYLDKNAKKKAPTNPADGSMIVDFGKVVQGRASDVVRFYVKNEHPNGYPITLEPEAMDRDLMFLEAPGKLRVGQVGEVAIQFVCPIDRIDPLNTAFGFRVTILNLNE